MTKCSKNIACNIYVQNENIKICEVFTCLLDPTSFQSTKMSKSSCKLIVTPDTKLFAVVSLISHAYNIRYLQFRAYYYSNADFLDNVFLKPRF
jgi:hypothetical protein